MDRDKALSDVASESEGPLVMPSPLAARCATSKTCSAMLTAQVDLSEMASSTFFRRATTMAAVQFRVHQKGFKG